MRYPEYCMLVQIHHKLTRRQQIDKSVSLIIILLKI